MSSKALAAKELGNTAFKSGDYPTAIGHYTTAILQDRQNPTFLLNRAAAYLKLGKFVDAENDCTKVLALSEKNVKGLFRRGQARVGQNKLDEARSDLETAARYEPNDSAVKSELEQVITKMNAAQKKAPVIHDVKPSPTAFIPRQIPIKIVDTPAPPMSLKSALKSTTKQPETLQAVSTRSLPKTNAEPSPSQQAAPVKPQPSAPGVSSEPSRKSANTPPPPASNFTDAKLARDTARPSRVGGGIFRASGKNTIFRTPGPDNIVQLAPKTLFELDRIWNSASPSERYRIISSIPIDQYPTLFQASLEAELLASICDNFLQTLEQTDVAEQVVASMNAFAKLPRFGTLLLFFSSREKGVVQQLADRLGVERLDAKWKL